MSLRGTTFPELGLFDNSHIKIVNRTNIHKYFLLPQILSLHHPTIMAQQSELANDSDAFSALMGTFNQMLKKYSEKTDLSQILPNLQRITPDSVITLKKAQGCDEEASESVSKQFVCPYFYGRDQSFLPG